MSELAVTCTAPAGTRPTSDSEEPSGTDERHGRVKAATAGWRPTIADVARCGVSRALVSIVFRGVDGASEATRRARARGRRRTGLPARLPGPGPAPQPHPQPRRAVLPAQAVRGRAGRAHVPRGREAGLPPAAGRVHPRPRAGCGGRRAAELPLRGADRRRSRSARARPRAAARRGGRGRGRPRGDQGPGRRGPQRRRHRHPAGGRAPGRASGTARSPTSTAAPTPARNAGARATARRWPTTAWTPRSGWYPVATPRTRGRAPPGRCWRTGSRRP